MKISEHYFFPLPNMPALMKMGVVVESLQLVLACTASWSTLYCTHTEASVFSPSRTRLGNNLFLTMDGSQEIEMEEKPTLKTIPREKEDLEDLLIEFGGFGKYQKRLFCLLMVFLFAAIPLLQNTQARSSVLLMKPFHNPFWRNVRLDQTLDQNF